MSSIAPIATKLSGEIISPVHKNVIGQQSSSKIPTNLSSSPSCILTSKLTSSPSSAPKPSEIVQLESHESAETISYASSSGGNENDNEQDERRERITKNKKQPESERYVPNGLAPIAAKELEASILSSYESSDSALFDKSSISGGALKHNSSCINTENQPGPLEARSERSNSCSQADGSAQLVSSVGINVTSLSHENLMNAAALSSSSPTDSCSTGHLCAELVDQTNQRVQATVSCSKANQAPDSSSSSTSYRFFSSKLNTGSLWSLLSNNSLCANEASLNDQYNEPQTNQQTNNDKGQSDNSNRNSGFFSRVQFKRNNQASTRSLNQEQQPRPTSEFMATLTQEVHLNSQERKRLRFNVKYIGGTILHKNFTLPMLEWIAKDLKRQTVKGAQVTSHRQYNFPARDIVLEIQSYQLKGISCKDGHCIFVHPMDCVSKYAQLQHDPTCFSYLIRDTKDSPYFSHVFQAKSANKVHEIFSAIREATTQVVYQSVVTPSSEHFVASGPIRASKSSEQMGSEPISSPVQQSNSPPVAQPSLVKPLTRDDDTQAVNQFENSYQFEVMFVKKVKLQCRRVPATFVDDALETLKSFEVLKGGDSKAQIKGLGKRIISASVDERQEYDEQCQSPTPSSGASCSQGEWASKVDIVRIEEPATDEDPRRNSSVSLHKSNSSEVIEERKSRSCQQSPTKQEPSSEQLDNLQIELAAELDQGVKKHQSMDCLKSIGFNIKPAREGDATFTNDFSPYNTITSTDLNERIAAIPVVSSSVSLDHETRQKLARQVRETIMATAANIKKGLYASGDKLDSSTSSKALDSLSCTVPSNYGNSWDHETPAREEPPSEQRLNQAQEQSWSSVCYADSARRSSAGVGPVVQQHQSSNNFDLFRRASARQVVKNRTMLLLIGKDELCTISIDKHQMLFSKSFTSIVHCLQGNNNKDHFGLICRDSGKINPNAESYAGFIFKCQSEKVVREIMGALKQVIYSSQHNYHGYNSPYNPLNSVSVGQYNKSLSPKVERINLAETRQTLLSSSVQSSVAARRGFLKPIDIDEAHRNQANDKPSTSSPTTKTNLSGGLSATIKSQPKNLIKSMFCDNCPLYWYHRLCCDVESLPGDVIKAIILRRIDSSLAEKEQDELYSRFSEFKIDTVDEHNEIFMSLLRHLCERKQLKHNQCQSHLSALAKSSALSKQQSASTPTTIARQSSLQREPNSFLFGTREHQRSGSSSGSLAFVLGQSSANQAGQSIADARLAAIDNLKKAKNSISEGIESILKRRSSAKDDTTHEDGLKINASLPIRSGSFKSTSRESRDNDLFNDCKQDNPALLKRSQSTSDYSNDTAIGQWQSSSWKDSLSKTINDDLANPLVGLFCRRGSMSTANKHETTCGTSTRSTRTSTECLSQVDGLQSPGKNTESRTSNFNLPNDNPSSSMLSSAFWKKSIFDKIRQPVTAGEEIVVQSDQQRLTNASSGDQSTSVKKRSSAELRSLWRKVILEQITLLKMDKQNQCLMVNAKEHNIQRVKLNYRDIQYSRESPSRWDKLLKQDPTSKVDFVEVANLVKLGIPKQRRGEVWMFLTNQYQLRHGTSFQPSDRDFRGDANQIYRSLLSQLSVQQHEIFVDIGRTFPTHPYYSQYLSIGQLSLFNLLKAYSLLDPDVGYCQGLSFVAGILLLHVDTEDEAFELMRHLLFNFGLRKQYLPSMNALHLQLYQITRLLRDHEYDLFNHFDHHDISPSLYAAPWFLTLFASQFPLGFVSRLLDLIFLIGIEAIFRVSLSLLAYHRTWLLSCNSLEATMDYIKKDLVNIEDKNLVKIFDQSMSLDLRNKLIEYEIEYTFYCAEDRARSNDPHFSKNSYLKANNGTRTNDTDDQTGSKSVESTSVVADATATIIIQHLLANNHLKSLKTNYSY